MNGAVLANLRLIHRAAGFFWIEDSAYREAKGAPFINQMQEHKSTGFLFLFDASWRATECLCLYCRRAAEYTSIGKPTGNGKHILLLLGIFSLLLRTRIRK